MCITPNSLIFRHSKGNKFSTPDSILMKLHMHHYIMVIYTQYKFLLLLDNLWLMTEKFIDILKTKGQYLLYYQGHPNKTSCALTYNGHIYSE